MLLSVPTPPWVDPKSKSAPCSARSPRHHGRKFWALCTELWVPHRYKTRVTCTGASHSALFIWSQ